VGLGESERFCAFGAGDSDESDDRACSESGFDAPPIYFRVSDEESHLLSVMHSSFVPIGF
jgi:hypothetical protein